MRYGAAVALALVSFAIAMPVSANIGRIEVTARVSHTNTAHLPPIGRGGDAHSSLWLVRDRYARVIGDLVFDCRWITAGLQFCVGQLSLPLGTIAVMGASRTSFVGQLAVVGGTGFYRGANGTLLFTATGRGRYVLSINYRNGVRA